MQEQVTVEASILQVAAHESQQIVADFTPGYINLKIPLQERLYWSPQLTLTFESTEEGTIIRGLYGPSPNVWTAFFFGYAACGILALIAGMWGFARYSLSLSAEMLWALPVLGEIALSLYIIAQMGQKIGAEQMFRLHLFYEEFIQDKIPIS